MIDQDKVRLLIQFALAVASQNDEWDNRELGPIHLVKYVYIADLAYAQAHNGQTYTGIPWNFHKFGPWSEDVYHEIEPALQDINATMKKIPGKYDDDFVRWIVEDESIAESLEKQLELHVALHVKDAVRQFGAYTESLLHHVYNSSPMLYAAPNECLDFNTACREQIKEEKTKQEELSEGQIKRKRKKREKLQEELKKRLELKKQKSATPKVTEQPSPRYDEVFYEGLEWLDSLAGEEVKEDNFSVAVDPEIWKSKARYDPDLS